MSTFPFIFAEMVHYFISRLRRLLAAFLFAAGSVLGQAAPLQSVHYTVSEGLADSSPTQILQDDDGRIWISTWNGLSVFDGNRFRTERLGTVVSMHLADPNTLWIVRSHDVCRLDLRTKDFHAYNPGHEAHTGGHLDAFKVAVSPDRQVFIASSGWGIAAHDAELDRMVPFNLLDFNASKILALSCPSPSRLLAVGNDGEAALFYYRQDTDEGIKVIRKTSLLPGRSVSWTFTGRKETFLVTDDYRLWVYDHQIDSLISSVPLPVRERVNAIARKDAQSLFVAFRNGETYRLSLPDGTAERIPALDGKTVSSLCYDRQRILWAGIDGFGLEALYEDHSGIRKWMNESFFHGKTGPVSSFAEDSRGNLLASTKGNGICRFSPDGRITVFNQASGLGDNRVHVMTPDGNGNILIGHEGLGISVLRDGRLYDLPFSEGPRPENIQAIQADPDGSHWWIGTFSSGLFRFRLSQLPGGSLLASECRGWPTSYQDTTCLPSPFISSIVPLGPGKACVSMLYGNIVLVDADKDRIRPLRSSDIEPAAPLPTAVLCMMQARDSSLWIGTGGQGLIHLTDNGKGTYRLRYWTEDDGMPDSSVHALHEDRHGNIWMSTNRGLSRFTPADSSFFNLYDTDRLQGNEFTNNAVFLSRSDSLYFGGTGGFNAFHPDRIALRDFDPDVVFESFAVNQRDIPGFRADQPVRLSHRDNFFSVSFCALDFIENRQCEYAYMLKGFDKDWVYCGNSNTATFTNVPPGHYTLSVRATNGDKVWGTREATLPIHVARPWWKTWPAWLIYALLSIALLYKAGNLFTTHVEQAHRLELEDLEKARQKETYEAKLRFFTSIAHEFGTPLTLILGASEQASIELRSDSKSLAYLSLIKDNVSRMQRLIQELIEFRRVETDNRQPVYSRVNLSAMLQKVMAGFEKVDQGGIRLEATLPSEEVVIVSDDGALEKILYNLLSNAYKYTPDNGWIQVALDNGKDGTRLRVRNAGKGIRPEDLGKVFNRFTILDEFEEKASQGKPIRNGIGMALTRSLVHMLSGDISVTSERGKYTEFVVTLPAVGEDHITRPAETASSPVGRIPAVAFTPLSEKPGAPSVMIVDDERPIRDLVADILKDNYTVLGAGNGKEAIEYLKYERPDLIISDISMPGMDGIELLKYLRGNEITKHIPIVLLTFKTEIENEVKGYEMGSDAFIPKPFYPKHLKAVVDRLLSSRMTLREYYNSALSNQEVLEGNVVNAEDKQFIVRLTQFVEASLSDEKLDIDFLCENLNVSKMFLYRKLKSTLQMSPNEYIRLLRLRKASHLLATTPLSVKEIMYQSGFNHKSYFYREFSRKYGMTPREWRARHTGSEPQPSGDSGRDG